jgi:CheY-like chemotaxis protein
MKKRIRAMNSPHTAEDISTSAASQRSTGIKEIVIVDSACERYADFIAAAEAGEVGLHFCVDGQSAVRLARRFRADVWLVAGELPDMSGFDLLEILMPCVSQGSVDPLLGGAHISLDHVGEGMRSGVFVVAEQYRLEDEQRALASAAAGYIVGPVTIDTLRTGRSRVPATT